MKASAEPRTVATSIHFWSFGEHGSAPVDVLTWAQGGTTWDFGMAVAFTTGGMLDGLDNVQSIYELIALIAKSPPPVHRR